VTSDDLADFQTHMAAQVVSQGRRKGDKLKHASVNRRVSAVTSLITWAVRKGRRDRLEDPPDALPTGNREIKCLSHPQQSSLLRAIEKAGDRQFLAIVCILIHTGLRVSEAVDLVWGDVDLTRGAATLHVRQGKGKKPRPIELDAVARKAFKALADLITEVLGPGHVDRTDPVFLGQSRKGGRPRLGIQGIQKRLARYARSARLRTVSPHQLRHTFATNHLAKGTPPEIIQAWMGHSRYETTAIYLHVMPQDRRAAMDRFDQAHD